jgi:hypothetical protein
LVPVPPPPVVGVPVPPEGVVAVPAEVAVPALGVVPVAAEVAVPPVVAVSVPEVVVVDVPEELELELDDAAAVLTADVGTVNGGAPEVSGVPEPPPPQAVSPTVSVRAATAADSRRVRLRARS